MPNREKVIREFRNWCEAMADECPRICYRALDLLEEQEEQIKKFELERSWDKSPDMMGKW